MPSIVFRFYDLEVLFQSESQAAVDRLGYIYNPFWSATNLSSPRSRSEIVLVPATESASHSSSLIVDGFEQHLKEGSSLEAYVFVAIMQTVLHRVRSHYLIHAGAVCAGGKAVVLAADTMYGKSTLTLELVRRGYQFLSDEIAAIGREDSLVYPFPRCLRLCPDTLSRLGFIQAAKRASIWEEKTLTDIEDILPGSRGDVAEMRHVIVLKDPSSQPNVTSHEEGRWLSILIDHANEPFLADLRELSTVNSLVVNISDSFPLLEMFVSSKQAALPGIEAACQKHQITLYQVYPGKDRRPSFDHPARLTEISKSHMAMELIKRMLGGWQSELIQEDLDGDPKRLLLELSTLLRATRCWELSVGPLEQMADLVCGLPLDG